MTGTLVTTEELTNDVVCFQFKTDQPISFTAGQFIELTLPHENADARSIKRWFTVSSSPTEPLLAITTRKSESMSTFKQTLFSLTPSSQVIISQPMGDFVLPMRPIPVLFIALGIGITPVRSIVKYLTDTKSSWDLGVLYVSRRPGERLYSSLIESYTPNITYLEQTPQTTRDIQNIVLAALAKKPDTLVYLSGPEEFIEQQFKNLRANDVASAQLIPDYFHGYASE